MSNMRFVSVICFDDYHKGYCSLNLGRMWCPPFVYFSCHSVVSAQIFYCRIQMMEVAKYFFICIINLPVTLLYLDL